MTWGFEDAFATDSSDVSEQLQGVKQIQSTFDAFAAILADGSVVTWGDVSRGGDSAAVRGQLVNVQHIQSSCSAFAAILADGSVVTWGDPQHGGDSRAVQEELQGPEWLHSIYQNRIMGGIYVGIHKLQILQMVAVAAKLKGSTFCSSRR